MAKKKPTQREETKPRRNPEGKDTDKAARGAGHGPTAGGKKSPSGGGGGGGDWARAHGKARGGEGDGLTVEELKNLASTAALVVLLVEAAGSMEKMFRVIGPREGEPQVRQMLEPLVPASRGGVREGPEAEEAWRVLVRHGLKLYGLDAFASMQEMMAAGATSARPKFDELMRHPPRLSALDPELIEDIGRL